MFPSLFQQENLLTQVNVVTTTFVKVPYNCKRNHTEIITSVQASKIYLLGFYFPNAWIIASHIANLSESWWFQQQVNVKTGLPTGVPLGRGVQGLSLPQWETDDAGFEIFPD